ncbi:DegT/DnrJ/EryC1/StrS family aminotransferase [Formicincola oecophyllae]|uniref:DegT/DnrJ/EryC1/StrS family aminotransferase n=1 Tax=Formicincola oecophyllae TaxID=2558361 RepID=A0A4Y6UBF2_9PROT|nr:DegT/DnrJ/EryC1/StrS family aminotransferase [Formicincola oecophyllae]QDH14464.1 DegT/DnrJ/EryC1/StrS family aminotransferase [Formicincola oecophyllae]
MKSLPKRLEAVQAHGRFVLGPEVAELEGALAARVGGGVEAIGVSSGTDALLAILMGEGVGPGDAVFLPTFTYTATAEVILLLGAMPVFVDVDPDTFQIDMASLKRRHQAIVEAGTHRPRAVMGVDLFGQPAPWAALNDFASDHGLFTVDDAAQAFGATLAGRPLGGQAMATALSFFPSKPLGGWGDGGAILTADPRRAALYRSLRSHGEGRERYDVQRIGLNARLDTLQAAVLLAKLEIFDDDLKRRRHVAALYDRLLGGQGGLGVQVPARVPSSESAWAVYTVKLAGPAARAHVQKAFEAAGLPCAVYYPRPLHKQPAYSAVHDGAPLPVAEALSGQVLALPIHPDMTQGQVQRVANTLLEALRTPSES